MADQNADSVAPSGGTVLPRTMVDIVTAAQEWVESITSHPNQWSSDEDKALIVAVRRHIPGVRCPWMERPDYEGWPDSTDPQLGRSGIQTDGSEDDNG